MLRSMRSALIRAQGMDKKVAGIRRNIIILVSLVSIVFLTGGVWLGVWSARSMRESVVEQFNEEQLVIAHSVASLIEKDLGSDTVWVSQPQTKKSGISVALGVELPGDPPRLLLFNTYVSWFLAPFLTNIRSGKTGYAWLIDKNGVFLFHPESDFVGKSVFESRKAKDPAFLMPKSIKGIFKTNPANRTRVQDNGDILKVIIHHQLNCVNNLIINTNRRIGRYTFLIGKNDFFYFLVFHLYVKPSQVSNVVLGT